MHVLPRFIRAGLITVKIESDSHLIGNVSRLTDRSLPRHTCDPMIDTKENYIGNASTLLRCVCADTSAHLI